MGTAGLRAAHGPGGGAGLQAAATSGQDWPAIQAAGTLRVLVLTDTLPETFWFGPESPPGLERELVEGFAGLHPLKVDHVRVASVADRIPALLQGRGHLIVGEMAVTEARRKLVDFTSEVLPLRHVVVTQRPTPVIETLAELRRARVATLAGSSWAEHVAAAGVPAENVEHHDQTAPVGETLRSGRASALVLSTVWAILEQRKDPRLQVGLFLGPPSSQAWAVRKDARCCAGRSTSTWPTWAGRRLGAVWWSSTSAMRPWRSCASPAKHRDPLAGPLTSRESQRSPVHRPG